MSEYPLRRVGNAPLSHKEPDASTRRNSHIGRMVQFSVVDKAELYLSAENDEGCPYRTDDHLPYYLIRGSVIVVEITYEGRLLVTRVAGPGSSYSTAASTEK
jgi:hypothetical protein